MKVLFRIKYIGTCGNEIEEIHVRKKFLGFKYYRNYRKKNGIVYYFNGKYTEIPLFRDDVLKLFRKDEQKVKHKRN